MNSRKTRPGIRISHKASTFTESVIREMTRVANAHGAVNLAQGFPEFPAPEELKEAAVRHIRADINQYAPTWGAPALRQAIADFMSRRRGVSVDPETMITVCCGATEAMLAAMMAVLDPGDEEQQVHARSPWKRGEGHLTGSGHHLRAHPIEDTPSDAGASVEGNRATPLMDQGAEGRGRRVDLQVVGSG